MDLSERAIHHWVFATSCILIASTQPTHSNSNSDPRSGQYKDSRIIPVDSLSPKSKFPSSKVSPPFLDGLLD